MIPGFCKPGSLNDHRPDAPNIRRDLAFPRQLDHMHWWGISPFLAGSAFQRGFKFPDRRIARTPDRIERKAGFDVAAVALHFEPTVTAIETLLDSWRWLRRSAVPFHA